MMAGIILPNEAKELKRLNVSLRLSDLKPGQRGTVSKLLTAGPMRRRLLDMGLVEGTAVECVGRSPGRDPSAYLIRGAVIAIRRVDGNQILLHTVEEGMA